MQSAAHRPGANEFASLPQRRADLFAAYPLNTGPDLQLHSRLQLCVNAANIADNLEQLSWGSSTVKVLARQTKRSDIGPCDVHRRYIRQFVRRDRAAPVRVQAVNRNLKARSARFTTSNPANLGSPKAGNFVIVDDPHCLHERIADRGTYEAEAATL